MFGRSVCLYRNCQLRSSSSFLTQTRLWLYIRAYSTMLHSAGTQQPGNSIETSARHKMIFAPAGDAPDPSSHQAVQYHRGTLNLSDLAPSPLTQFNTWFDQAREAQVHQPETVTLATAELPSGRVSCRVVYLKELDDHGFVIYSNWDTSRKASDIRSNPQAALDFWWRGVERQVRVEGPVERLTEEESQVYYDTRIRGSRIGAWASQQSKVLDSREELEKRVSETEKKFEGQEKIPVPPFWGGLRIIPHMVEFWQGRESRLHDRFRYTKDESAENGWRIERLSP